jgi:hypothetical protein
MAKNTFPPQLPCLTSPCRCCPHETKKAGCTTKVANQMSPGCLMWTIWFRRGWSNIHRQGMVAIRARAAKHKE